MSTNLNTPNHSRSQRRVGFYRNATNKILSTLLLTILATIFFGVGLQRVHSAPNGIAGIASQSNLSSPELTAGFPVAAPPQACVTPPSGMVAWWPLDEANGSATVRDLAGFNNQGVPKPGTPLGAANAPNAVAGRVAGAVNFNSNQQTNGPNIEVANHSELNFGSGDLSIDAWAFVPKPPAVYIHPVVDKLVINSAGTQGTGYALYLVSSFATGARLQFVMGNGGPLANYLSPNVPSVPFNTWTHIAVTINRGSNTVKFYVNGSALAAAGPAIPAGSTTNTLPLLIGESRAPGLVQAAITLDEIEMFSRTLQQGEIQGIANAGPAGKCKCLGISNETISCNGGVYVYKFTVTNFTAGPVSVVNFAPVSNITITPNPVNISPLLSGASTTITVTIGGPGAVGGATVCFYVGLAGPAAPACRIQHCVTLPFCHNQLPDLVIKKQVQCGGAGIPPTTCHVTFIIGNNGPGTFNGILTIKDVVSPTPPTPGLTWAGSSTPPGFSCGIGPSDTIGCGGTGPVSLPPGQTTTVNLTVNVPAGHYKNCATVTGYTQFPYNASTLVQESNTNNNQSCVPMP